MMFYEFPLIAFTVLGQTAVGAYLTVTTYQLLYRPDEQDKRRLIIARFAILIVMGIGFLFSSTHLGSPLLAFNAFNQVGTVALSNEILLGASFFVFAGVYWLLCITHLGNPMIKNIVNGLSIILAILFMVAMANVYYIDTVPAWNSAYTGIDFGFTVITLGILYSYVLLRILKLGKPNFDSAIAWGGISLIVIHLAIIPLQTIYYLSLTTAIHDGFTQLHTLRPFLIARVLLLAAVVVLWLFLTMFVNKPQLKTPLLVLLLLLLFTAEIFGRNVFYGMHFTLGLT